MVLCIKFKTKHYCRAWWNDPVKMTINLGIHLLENMDSARNIYKEVSNSEGVIRGCALGYLLYTLCIRASRNFAMQTQKLVGFERINWELYTLAGLWDFLQEITKIQIRFSQIKPIQVGSLKVSRQNVSRSIDKVQFRKKSV